MNIRRRHLAALAVLAPLLLVASGCAGGGDAPAPDPTEGGNGAGNPEVEALGGEEHAQHLQDLYDAALAAGENTVVVYGTVAGEREKIFDRFEEMFPEIDVQLEFLSGSDLFARINQEVASGQMVADMILTGDTSTVALAEAGRLETYLPPLVDELDDEYVDPNGQFAAATVTPFGLTFNTDSVDASQVPGSWDAVIDPEYRGQLAWVDLTSIGPSLVPTSRLLAAGVIDEEWLNALKAQEVHFTGTAAALSGVLATGEFPIAINYPYDYYMADTAKGVPVEFQLMESDNYVATNAAAKLVDAPHPNAAELMFGWLFTPAAQQVMADIGQFSPMPGAVAPEGLPPLSEISTVPSAAWTELGAQNREALEITKRIFG